MRTVILYLEHSPREESLTRQLTEATANKERITKEFDYTFPSGTDQKTRESWLDDMGIRAINRQIKILSYILGSED